MGLGATGSVKQHIMRLRRKFNDSAKDPRWFANVPGVGYRFIGGQTTGVAHGTNEKSRTSGSPVLNI